MKLIFMYGVRRDGQGSFSHMNILLAQQPLLKVVSLLLSNSTFHISQVTCVRVYFWTLNCVPLVYLPILTPILHCLNFCPKLYFLFKTVLSIFGPFSFPYKFQKAACQFPQKKPYWDLIDMALNVLIQGKMISL